MKISKNSDERGGGIGRGTDFAAGLTSARRLVSLSIWRLRGAMTDVVFSRPEMDCAAGGGHLGHTRDPVNFDHRCNAR
jgi:hypothetical protein